MKKQDAMRLNPNEKDLIKGLSRRHLYKYSLYHLNTELCILTHFNKNNFTLKRLVGKSVYYYKVPYSRLRFLSLEEVPYTDLPLFINECNDDYINLMKDPKVAKYINK